MMDENIRKAIAPDMKTREKIKAAIENYAIYMIIVLVTALVVVIPPLVSGCLYGDVGMFFPKDVEGWILWGITNGGTSIGNVSLLVLFKMQAKRNVRDNENFKKANEILNRLAREKSVLIPRSPGKMNFQDYSSKVLPIIISTVSSFLVLTSVVVNFSVITLISTIVSATITLSTSWATMLKNEEYWTDEYLLYAEMIEKKINKEEIIQ